MKPTNQYWGLVLMFAIVYMGSGVQAQSWRHSIALEYDVSSAPKWNTVSTFHKLPAYTTFKVRQPRTFSLGLNYTYVRPTKKWQAMLYFNWLTFCHTCSYSLEELPWDSVAGRISRLGRPSRSIPQGTTYYTLSLMAARKFAIGTGSQISLGLGPVFQMGRERYFLGSLMHASGVFWEAYFGSRPVRDWGLATRLSYDRVPRALTELSRIPWHKHLGWSVWAQARYYFLMSRLYWNPAEFVTGAPTTFSLGVSLRYYFGVRE